VGIDGAAHAATMDAGGVTIGVSGSGLDDAAPRANRRLARRILDRGGATVSELAPGVRASAGTFPRRNRIISGLSDATVVVEAGTKSGALVTANWALDQGRDVFFVPGSIDSPSAAGCLSYLRTYHDQARIVSGVPQLLEDLGVIDTAWLQRSGARDAKVGATLVELGGTARRVALQLVAGHRTADELVATTGLPVASVLTALTLLESRGLVAGVYGRYRPIGALANSGKAAAGGEAKRAS
jgi:DNA processing protein